MKHQFTIRRFNTGFVVEWLCDGKPLFCGAERVWYGEAAKVVTPFPTFKGAEWYRGEWVM